MVSEAAQRVDLLPDGFPVRKGPRPKTLIGPMRIQCDGHGDARHLNQLVKVRFSSRCRRLIIQIRRDCGIRVLDETRVSGVSITP